MKPFYSAFLFFVICFTPAQEINDDITKLQTHLHELEKSILLLEQSPPLHPQHQLLLPDVLIFQKAILWALENPKALKASDIKYAHQLLDLGIQRSQSLLKGETPWLHSSTTIIRGYQSTLDQSIQPYLLYPPKAALAPPPQRLDVWCHGRNPNITELQFLIHALTKPSPISAPTAYILEPYGRCCCANKFAGEVDLFEALAHTQAFFAIDQKKINLRGFSMGGAAVWHLASHYPDLWCCANPGAGFSETPEYLTKNNQQNWVDSAPWYQKKLWHWYNATDYALNFFHCPLIAYSGGKDRQIQAAQVMERSLLGENIELTHFISPEFEHKMDPLVYNQIESSIQSILSATPSSCPTEIHFTTWFLRYSKVHWLQLLSLEQHWTRSRIHAKLINNQFHFKTQNISAFAINMKPGQCPLSIRERPTIFIDDIELKVFPPKTDRSWTVHFQKINQLWQQVPSSPSQSLQKKPGLQGPIDDAFLHSFLHVLPSQKGWHPANDQWTQTVSQEAFSNWKNTFHGDAPRLNADQITEQQLQDHNLILWGDPSSNPLIAKILPHLPLQWDSTHIKYLNQTWDSHHSIPALIYPSPWNPQRYIVLNSGTTLRPNDNNSNALQTPKLPDWAILSTLTPPTAFQVADILDAGFFNESWQFNPHPQQKY